MAYHSGEKLLIAATASFLGGALVGMLIGKENRIWVAENAGELAQRLGELTQDAKKKTYEGYEELRENVEKNVRHKA
ncbi:MAG: hypothetical protein WD266_03450 [Balneolales bacterium]